MSASWRFSRMLAKWALASVFLTQACSASEPAPAGDQFRLCSEHPDHKSVITIDYKALRGFSEDYSEPVKSCGKSSTPCIAFPILLSVPRHLPTSASEIIRWSAGSDQFSIRSLPGAVGAYSIEAVDYRTGSDGRPVLYGRGLYTYTRDMGITTFHAQGDTARGMVRCAGRLTFEDLRALVARLR